MEPILARPVPFWRHGFAPPPLTSPRASVDAVPRRRASCSARTASYTMSLWKRSPKSGSGSSRLPCAPRRLALGTAHLHEPALRARHGAADDQQIAARVDLDHLEPELSHALVAHLARHPNALDHAGGS